MREGSRGRSGRALEAAFRAATGHKAAFSTRDERGISRTRPVAIVELPFGPVLLTATELEDACHNCGGAIGVHYLVRRAEGFIATRSWPAAIPGWSWGQAPDEWRLTRRFTRFPAIWAEGSITAMGETCTGATITELRPEGPVTSPAIALAWSNAGAVAGTPGHRGPDGVRTLEGRVVNVRRGRGFAVAVEGSARFREYYDWRGDRFVPRASMSRLQC